MPIPKELFLWRTLGFSPVSLNLVKTSLLLSGWLPMAKSTRRQSAVPTGKWNRVGCCSIGKQPDHPSRPLTYGMAPLFDGVGKHKSFLMIAETEEEMYAWIECIRAAMMTDPVYALYMRRKQQLQ